MISFQAYMFYQLKSFDESLSDAVIATQAGMLASSFTGAQFLTAMMWGRISDSERGGRKLVLLIGLFGTSECFLSLSTMLITVTILTRLCSDFCSRIWILQDFLASCIISNFGWCA